MASKAQDAPKKRYDLVESFDALALAGGKRDSNTPPSNKQRRHRVPNKDGGFVGGFSPALAVAGSVYASPSGWKPSPFRRATGNDGNSRPFYGGMHSPGPLPIPPAIAHKSVSQGQQQSLTMQHALGPLPSLGLMPFDPQTPPSRPYSASVLPPPSYRSPSTNASSSPPGAGTPSRPRASSEPLSPSTTLSKNGTVQCSGVTKAGKQCSRQVKSGSALSTVNPGAQMERFCHQHAKELLGVVGFYSHKIPDTYINFQGKTIVQTLTTCDRDLIGCRKIGFPNICNRTHKSLCVSKWRNLDRRQTFQATSILLRFGVSGAPPI